MAYSDLFETLKHLELELHQPMVRSDVERLNALLHESFIEFGRSGCIYSRDEILEELLKEESGISVWSQDFAAEEISHGVVLITYKSAHINSKGELSCHSIRSSLWQQTPNGWRLRFHQGTSTDAFAEHSS